MIRRILPIFDDIGLINPEIQPQLDPL